MFRVLTTDNMGSNFFEHMKKYVGPSHTQRAEDRLSGFEAKFDNVLQNVRMFFAFTLIDRKYFLILYVGWHGLVRRTC